MDYQKYVDGLEREALRHESPPYTVSLEAVLKGKAIELWSDLLGERLWLVGDEGDVLDLGEPRGSVYTAQEARLVCRVTDPDTLMDLHQWKREVSGTVSEYRPATSLGDSGGRPSKAVNRTRVRQDARKG